MNYLWVSGWGVPSGWMRDLATGLFPEGVHQVVPPVAEHELLRNRNRFDRVIGYSLGAFLLLREEIADPCGRPVGLLAPFFSFVAENRCGGSIRRTQLRYLTRWFARDPRAALDDFYERAGLSELTGHRELPYEPEKLAAGLDVLNNETAPPLWPGNAAGFIGAEDSLLDAERLSVLCPQLNVVTGAGHHPAPLMKRLAHHWNSQL